MSDPIFTAVRSISKNTKFEDTILVIMDRLDALEEAKRQSTVNTLAQIQPWMTEVKGQIKELMNTQAVLQEQIDELWEEVRADS